MSELEAKAVKLRMEGMNLVVEVDLNKDGQNFLTLNLDLSEVADEVFSAFKKD